MKKIKILISLFILLMMISVWAQNIGEQLNFDSLPIPGPMRATMRNYLAMIGVSNVSNDTVWAENTGIKSYNEQILRDHPCFNDLIRAFEGSLPQNFGSDVRMDQRNPEAPGWLWQRAMRFANNNPNLAMMLIGQCGHDDVEPCQIGSPVRRNNPRFIPGSLGAETILSPALAQQIADLQAPNMGTSALPAKYYHTIGAAYLTCALVRDGMPSPMASMVQLTLARTYRVQRICSGTTTYGNYTPSIQGALRKYQGRSVRELVAMVRSGEIRPTLSDRVDRDFVSHVNDLMQQFDNSVERVVQHMDMEMSFVDATELFKDQVIGSTPNCRLPQITDEVTRRTQEVANNFQCQGNALGGGSGLSQERCEAAKARLRTWWADMRWTEEQHRLGAEFAKNNCQRDPNFMGNLNNLSCQALQQVQPGAQSQGTGTVEPAAVQ